MHVTMEHVTGVREPRTYEIVGVAGDANYLEIREAARRAIYLPAFHDGRVGAQTFLIRTEIDPSAMAADARRTVREVVPAVPVSDITTLSEQIDASIVPERLIATLSGFFGTLGALLAGIGIYGLLAYTVARRASEIGIRVALGATKRDVTRMVLQDALSMVIIGILVGLPLAMAGRSLVAALVQGAAAKMPLSLGLPILAILAVASTASYLPARRAASVDPMDSLRQE
jgi:ABC-type antimicrobial peptide transport system permease subunit